MNSRAFCMCPQPPMQFYKLRHGGQLHIHQEYLKINFSQHSLSHARACAHTHTHTVHAINCVNCNFVCYCTEGKWQQFYGIWLPVFIPNTYTSQIYFSLQILPLAWKKSSLFLPWLSS